MNVITLQSWLVKAFPSKMQQRRFEAVAFHRPPSVAVSVSAFGCWLLKAWSCRWPARAQSEIFHTRWLDQLPLANGRLQTQWRTSSHFFRKERSTKPDASGRARSWHFTLHLLQKPEPCWRRLLFICHWISTKNRHTTSTGRLGNHSLCGLLKRLK